MIPNLTCDIINFSPLIPTFSGYGQTIKVYTYNYVTSGNRLPKKNRHDQSSRHASTKTKEGKKKKENKISKNAQSSSNTAKQQVEEYVDMTFGDEGTSQTPLEYEVPTIAYF